MGKCNEWLQKNIKNSEDEPKGTKENVTEMAVKGVKQREGLTKCYEREKPGFREVTK